MPVDASACVDPGVTTAGKAFKYGIVHAGQGVVVSVQLREVT